MRINRDKILPPEKLGEVQLPDCPSLCREQAENILVLINKLPPIEYYSMGQFDKKLIAYYWRYIDGFHREVLSQTGKVNIWGIFLTWFVDCATNPEYIRRARQWLTEPGEHQYLIPNSNIQTKAHAHAGATRKEVEGDEGPA